MKTKVCSKCGIEKPISEFGKHKGRKDGLQDWCKTCWKLYCIEHREERRIYGRKYHLEHQKEIAVYKRKNCLEHQEEIAKYYKEYVARHPECIKAKSFVNNAIVSGKLTRPNRCSNPKCNKLCKPDGHHWSYLEEHWLDVEWLCKSCHKRLHALMREEINNG